MLDFWSVAIATGGLLLAGILKGATGLGFASCALPFLTFSLGLKPALTLVLVPALSTNIGVAVASEHLRETMQTFARLYLAIIPGVMVGVWLLVWIDQETAIQTLGIASIAYVALALGKPNRALPQQWHGVLQVPVGLANGLISGVTGSQVIPIVPFLMSLQMTSERTVQAVNLAVLLTSLSLLVGLLTTGIMSRHMLVLSIEAIVPAIVGVRIGIRARRSISEQQFRTLALIVIGSLGALLLAK